MKKYLISIVVLIAIILGCIFYFNSKNEKNISSNNNSKKEEIQNVTVAQWGQEKYLIYLPFYIAQEKNFFKNQGLNVNIKYSGNDDQVFATVLKGEAKFGIGDPVFTAISREKGAKGKVVASIVNGVALWGVSKNSNNVPNIKKIDDLKDLRIGTFPKPSTAYTLVKNTIGNNLEILEKTKIIEAGFGSQIALLESDNADIALQLEPGASIAENQGYKVKFSFPDFYGDFSFTGLSTIEDTTNNEPELVQKMVNGIHKANVYAHNNPIGAIEIAKKIFPNLDEKVVSNAVNRMLDSKTIPKTAFTSVEGWNKAVNLRVQVGDLKTSEGSEKSLDNSFAIKAAK